METELQEHFDRPMDIKPVNPMDFLEQLASSAGPAAKKLAILHLKPLLTPHLLKQGLVWSDVVPVLETVESIEELKAAAVELHGFDTSPKTPPVGLSGKNLPPTTSVTNPTTTPAGRSSRSTAAMAVV